MKEVFLAFVTLFFMIACSSVFILAVMAIVEKWYKPKPVVEEEEIPTTQIVLQELWHWKGGIRHLKKTAIYRPDIVEILANDIISNWYIKRTFFKTMKKFFTQEELKEFALFLQHNHYDSYFNSRKKCKRYRGCNYSLGYYYNGQGDSVTVIRFSIINRRYAKECYGVSVLDGIVKHIPNRILDKLLKQQGLV